MPRLELSQLYINNLQKAIKADTGTVKNSYIDSKQEGLCVELEKSGHLCYCYVYFDEKNKKKQLYIAGCSDMTLKEARNRAEMLSYGPEMETDISNIKEETPEEKENLGIKLPEDSSVANRPKWMKAMSFKGLDFRVSEIYDRFKTKVPGSQNKISKSDTPLAELRAVENHRATLNLIDFNFKDFFPLRVSEVNCYLLKCWTEEMRSTKEITPQTLNREVNAFRGMIHWAYRVGLIPEYKLYGYEALRETGKSAVGRRSLDKSEVNRLMAALEKREGENRKKRYNYKNSYTRKYRIQNGLPVIENECPPFGEGYFDYVFPMVCLALHTGARKGSLIGLKWRDINLDRKVITYQGEMSKAGNTILSPINNYLHKVLSKWKRQNEISNTPLEVEKYVLSPYYDPYQPISKTSPTCWKKLLRDAEITNFRWHDLRHTFASTLANNNIPLPTLQALMGHANIKTTSIYLHTTDVQKQSAVDLLEQAYQTTNIGGV